MKKKVFALVLTALMLTQLMIGIASASATPVTINTSVNGTIVVTQINVSIPVSLAFTIDPNDTETSYEAGVATIINQTNAPIKVTMEVGNSFRVDVNSPWKPTDFLPSEKDWETLGKSESESSIAIGLKISDVSEWRPGAKTTTLWAKEQQESLVPIVFGEIDPQKSAGITLEIYHGNAFSEAKTCNYNIVWSFTLAD